MPRLRVDVQMVQMQRCDGFGLACFLPLCLAAVCSVVLFATGSPFDAFTFRMRASHRQGETAGPPFLRKVCPRGSRFRLPARRLLLRRFLVSYIR